MNGVVDQMLARLKRATADDQKKAIKRTVQEIALRGLSRAGFFQKAAFYGGTALRIFYDLDRFSEDLDFSLLESDPNFKLVDWLPSVEEELRRYGFRFKSEIKVKSPPSAIQTGFVKGNAREHILICYADEKTARSVAGTETIKVKIEVDVAPPPYARFERRFALLPIPYEITLYDAPSLFAGKLHAVTHRAWKNRVKGRDLFDYVFYVSRRIPFNLKHLNARLVASSFDGAREDATLEEVKDILRRRFETIDYRQAKDDVAPFVDDPASLDVWSKEFFIAITENLTADSK